MPSGKRARQQRQAAVKAPPPVRSKGAPRGARQASPRTLAIAGAVVVLAAIGIGLAFAFAGGGGSGVPSGTPTVGRIDQNSLPGSRDVQDLYGGIPQDGLYLGRPDAPVQMVMFVDLQCPVCQNFEVTAMPTIVKKYIRTGNVRLYLRPWAFIGPDSFRGQKAVIAAARQNKAFNFAGVLYDNQGTENTGWMTDRVLAQISASVPGLNVPQLFDERSSGAITNEANTVDSEAKKDNVTGTPTIFVGKTGEKPKNVSGPGQAPTLADVEQAIDTALVKA